MSLAPRDRFRLLNTCGRGALLRRAPARPGDPRADKLAFSALDRIYSDLLRELPGGAVGVEPANKSDFLVDGAVTGPVDASDSESRSRWHGRIGKQLDRGPLRH